MHAALGVVWFVTALMRYNGANRAIAEAEAFDWVKGLRNRADALRFYARQSKNK
jgi:hypothetical protein